MDEMKNRPPDLNDVDPSHLWQIGGAIRKFSASLRFFGDDLIPERISSMLGCQPTIAYKKGDIIPNEKYHRLAATGSWILKGDLPEGEQIENQIVRLLSLVSDDLGAWFYLTNNFHADIFLGVFMESWNQGVELSHNLMLQICNRHLKLGFDIYCSEQSSNQ